MKKLILIITFILLLSLVACVNTSGSFNSQEDYDREQFVISSYLKNKYPNVKFTPYTKDIALHRTYSSENGGLTDALKSIYGYYECTGLNYPIKVEHYIGTTGQILDNYWDIYYYDQLLNYCKSQVETYFPNSKYYIRHFSYPDTTYEFQDTTELTFEQYKAKNNQKYQFYIELPNVDNLNEHIKEMIDNFDYMYSTMLILAIPPEYTINDMQINVVPVDTFITDEFISFTDYAYNDEPSDYDIPKYNNDKWNKIEIRSIYRDINDQNENMYCCIYSYNKGTSCGSWSIRESNNPNIISGISYEEALIAGDKYDKPEDITDELTYVPMPSSLDNISFPDIVPITPISEITTVPMPAITTSDIWK